MDLCHRSHHGGKLPGNHSLMRVIDLMITSGLCLNNVGSEADYQLTHMEQEQQGRCRRVVTLTFALSSDESNHSLCVSQEQQQQNIFPL